VVSGETHTQATITTTCVGAGWLPHNTAHALTQIPRTAPCPVHRGSAMNILTPHIFGIRRFRRKLLSAGH
jgi:hypothetical protein